MRPAVPEYCRATPTECVPFLRNPVSSTTSTPFGSPRVEITSSRTLSRSASALHEPRPSNDCIRYGRARPACSANCQPVLRVAPDNRPSMKALADVRVSARPNAGASRAFNAESSCSHFRSEPDHAATDIPNHPRYPATGSLAFQENATVVLDQLFQESLRGAQVSGLKPFGKPVIHRCQDIARLSIVPLVVPDFGQA